MAHIRAVLRSLLAGLVIAGTAATAACAPARGGDTTDVVADTGRIYTVAEVDRVANARFGQDAIRYPLDLRQQGHIGRVVAEFVVGPNGRIEPETFRVVSASHPEFAREVQDALPTLRYVAARKNGRPVRVRMMQAFDFRLSEYEGARRP